MTSKDIRKYASTITNIITMWMPRDLEDALDDVELDDLLQAIYNAVARDLERIVEDRADA